MNARMLPAHVDVDAFQPALRPWDERLLVPNGDLFRAFHDRSAEIVTDGVDRFTARGLRLNSGRELELTSSSRPRASTSWSSAGSRSRSTATPSPSPTRPPTAR